MAGEVGLESPLIGEDLVVDIALGVGLFKAFGKGLLREGCEEAGDYAARNTFFMGRQSLGAAASEIRTGLKGLLKDVGLPISGKVRFIPEKNALKYWYTKNEWWLR